LPLSDGWRRATWQGPPRSHSTALAEAELEYVDNHQSESVYVQLPVSGLGTPFAPALG